MYLIPITIFSIYSIYLNNTMFNYSIIITDTYDVKLQEKNNDIYSIIKVI
jgi:hypothetical protein